MKRALPLLLFLALPAAVLAQPAGKNPKISFGERSVTVDGIAPKGEVVWLSVAREVAPDDVATLVRRSDVLTDDDGDGRVRWDLDRAVPLRSIWVAVDLASGAIATATPEGYPLRRVSWRGIGLENSPHADRVADARSYAEVLLVRPGEGAWRMTVGDGSAEDDDGVADGRVAAALDDLRPLGRSAGAPARFGPRDVVVLIDPNRMELSVVEAGERKGGN
jgi:hypothetical protein